MESVEGELRTRKKPRKDNKKSERQRNKMPDLNRASVKYSGNGTSNVQTINIKALCLDK